MGAALAQLVAGPPPVILRLSFLPGPRTAATSASASSPLTKA